MIDGKVLDVSALRDLSAGDSQYTQALLTVSNLLGTCLAVPVVTLSSAWQSATVPERPWLNLLMEPGAEPSIVVVPVDSAQARSAGLLAADAGQPDAPQGIVHAAHLALTRSWPVVTRHPDVLLAITPDIRTETLP